jgi:hypothetical protein
LGLKVIMPLSLLKYASYLGYILNDKIWAKALLPLTRNRWLKPTGMMHQQIKRID